MTRERTPLVLLGAGGTALEAIDLIAALNARGERFDLVAALDDDPARHGGEMRDVPVTGPLSAAAEFPDALFVDTLGSPSGFRGRPGTIEALGIDPYRFATLVHPLASVSERVMIGPGTLVFAFAVLASGARLGAHVLVLPHSTVHHDASVGDWSILASQVVLAGDAAVGRCAYLGAGARIIQGGRVGDEAMVGMGSVVIREVRPGSTVAGNPAREIGEERP